MMQGNLEIVLSLNNIFNYQEYLLKTDKPLPEGEYAQKIGMLKCSMIKYPTMSPKEAYLKFIDDMNKEYTKTNPAENNLQTQNNIPPQPQGCGGCGKEVKIQDGGRLV